MSFNKPQPKFDTVIIRLAGEIGIKAVWTRKLYERRLISNIRAVLKHYAIRYEALNRTFGRLYLKTSQAQNASQKLTKVFGISSISPALETTSKLSDIISTSVQVIGSGLRKGNSFAVRCRRVGRHPYTSQDVCREVGRRILAAYPNLNLRVDLTHPEATLGVEVREDKAFIFTDTIKVAGGLPVGTQPKLVCLFKGDVNSTVACWLTMKRGCQPVFVHFDNSGFYGKKSNLDSVLNQARALSEWILGFRRRLKVISHSQTFAQIAEKYPQDLANLLCKRLMFKIAEQIADMERAEGIVTGETIGDKHGLTLHDFRIEDEAVKNYPIYRPVLGFDTTEIEDLAQRIGIQEVGAPKAEKCEAFFERQVPFSIEEVSQAEEKLSIEELIRVSIETIKTISL